MIRKGDTVLMKAGCKFFNNRVDSNACTVIKATKSCLFVRLPNGESRWLRYSEVIKAQRQFDAGEPVILASKCSISAMPVGTIGVIVSTPGSEYGTTCKVLFTDDVIQYIHNNCLRPLRDCSFEDDFFDEYC